MKKRNEINREALKSKMAEALNSDIKALSSDMKDILLDDLITALESRLKALKQSPSNVQVFADAEIKVLQ
jgi:hypothetical protein